MYSCHWNVLCSIYIYIYIYVCILYTSILFYTLTGIVLANISQAACACNLLYFSPSDELSDRPKSKSIPWRAPAVQDLFSCERASWHHKYFRWASSLEWRIKPQHKNNLHLEQNQYDWNVTAAIPVAKTPKTLLLETYAHRAPVQPPMCLSRDGPSHAGARHL